MFPEASEAKGPLILPADEERLLRAFQLRPQCYVDFSVIDRQTA